MKNKYKNTALLCVGMVLGALLAGGAAAAGMMAEPSWQPIYVDGRLTSMDAYNILGNNYVKLREIGQAVGFNVYWQDGVRVNSGAPYTGEAPDTEPPHLASADFDTEAIKAEIMERTNAVRRQHGLSALEYDAMTARAAQVRAEEMAAVSAYSHTRPNGSSRSTVTDCSYTGENIHRISDHSLSQTGRGLAETVVEEWAASPGHLENMVNPQISSMGVGLARGVNLSGEDCWYCVQWFLCDGYTITWVDEPITHS